MEAMKCPSCGSPNLAKLDASEYKCQNCNTRSKLSKDQDFLVLLQGYPCPSCGFSNESGVKYCGNCGTKLVKYCTNCASEVRLDINFCPNCGRENFSIHSTVNVVIKSVPPKRQLDVIKELRIMYHVGLGDAKKMTEKPSVVIGDISVSEALSIKSRLERAGAIVEIIEI